ncbi:MAG TPA: hypothetical protein PKA66_08830 [Gemmatimonadales bacterium]|nr:hypothetical protein [Gemmatimonadales bacterium]
MTRWTSPARALRPLVLVGLLAGTLAGCSEDNTTEPTPIPGATLALIPNLRAEDISADGKTVLLTDPFSATADFYFYDVATKVSTLKGAAGDAQFDFTTGISNGQRVSAIHGKPEQAGLWEQAGGWLDLGNIYPTGCEFDTDTGAQDQSGGWDIDSAGHVAVGLVWNACNAEAFMWSDAAGSGGFITLDLIGDSVPENGNPPINRATVISDNGLVAAGFASQTADIEGSIYWIDRRPALWTATGAGSFIPSGGVFTDDSPGEVLAIAGNGSLVTGVWSQMPFIWSSTLGTVNLASGTYEGFQGWGQATALDGQVVYGTMQEGFFGAPFPFFWTQAGGVVSLLDVAAANGITLPENYYWEAVVAASADGTLIVGAAYDETFTLNTYVLKVPASIYGL